MQGIKSTKMDMCSICAECCTYGAVNAVHVRAALCAQHVQASAIPHILQHVCYLCTQHVLLAHMHAIGMLHKCFLHVHMIQRAAYMSLAHMQATSVPHMWSLHICILLQSCTYAYYYSAPYMPLIHMQATGVAHTVAVKIKCRFSHRRTTVLLSNRRRSSPVVLLYF